MDKGNLFQEMDIYDGSQVVYIHTEVEYQCKESCNINYCT